VSTPIAFSEEERRLRAELAAELGWYPADLDDESVVRQRADAARKKTDRDPAKRWAHLTELARQRDVEERGREQVADLYERAVLSTSEGLLSFRSRTARCFPN
jgi:hypothetical protein